MGEVPELSSLVMQSTKIPEADFRRLLRQHVRGDHTNSQYHIGVMVADGPEKEKIIDRIYSALRSIAVKHTPYEIGNSGEYVDVMWVNPLEFGSCDTFYPCEMAIEKCERGQDRDFTFVLNKEDDFLTAVKVIDRLNSEGLEGKFLVEGVYWPGP